MAATADQIARLRRMAGGVSEYSDASLTLYIERYPLPDERGAKSYTLDYATSPPGQDANTDWIATYDLNAAAASLWSELAAGFAVEFDFETNDQRFDKSQKHKQAMAQARYFTSRMAPKSVLVLGKAYDSNVQEQVWIGNLPEGD